MEIYSNDLCRMTGYIILMQRSKSSGNIDAYKYYVMQFSNILDRVCGFLAEDRNKFFNELIEFGHKFHDQMKRDLKL